MSRVELESRVAPPMSEAAVTNLTSEGAAHPGRENIVPVGLSATVPETATGRPYLPAFGKQVALPQSLRALGHRNFRLFWSGQLISLVGTWMQAIARGWLVLELTNSAFWLGMVGFATAVPVLILSLWGGVVADRLPKRTLIIATQAIQMVLAFVLGWLTVSGQVQVWHIIAVSLMLGTVQAFDAPARQSFTVEMVGKADLMNAVALNSSIFNGARVLGPAIGAVVLAWQGAGMAFILNGFSYIAVIYGLFLMNVPQHVKKAPSKSNLGDIVEGLRYVRHDEVLAVMMIIVSTVSIFAFPYTTLMPIFADTILKVGKEGYGTLLTLAGIGSLIGALSLAVQSGKSSTRRGRTIMLGAIGLPLFLMVFSVSNIYVLSLAMLVGVGYTMISVNATINTIVQTNVPDRLRGRVNGVYALLFMGVAPLGNLQAGILADRFGAPMSVLIGAVITAIVVGIVLVRNRHVFQIE